ncbi:MAG: Ig-like domain-containing protein [bacterium]
MPEPFKLSLYPDASGFSFVELMVSMGIFLIVLLAAFEVITSQKDTFKQEQAMIETSQSSRASLDILLRELRTSGYKVLEADFLGSLSRWISSGYLPTSPKDVVLSYGTCPIFTEGNGSEPDMITLFMADIKENTLLAHVASDCNVIILDANAPGFSCSGKFRTDDIIRIGDHTEFAKVIGVSDNSLTIDTNPSLRGNQGLTCSYQAGVPIREINIVTYTVFNDENDPTNLYHTAGHPVLKRKHNEAVYMDVAEDVEDLQIIPATFPNYKLQIISRTSTRGNYTSGSPDGYKRVELLTDFRLRNFIDKHCLLPATVATPSLSGLDESYPCTIHVSWAAVTKDSQNESLSAECSISEYVIAYDTTPQTRSHSTYTSDGTSCDIDINDIKDPNHQTYYVSVAAVNAAGLGAFSAERSITDTHPPSSVSNLTATADGHSITLNWTADLECDVVAFRIYRSTSSRGPYTLIFDDPNFIDHNTETEGLDSYTYCDTNLPCHTYYYQVKTFDDKFESTSSPQSSYSIVDNDPPEVPTDFSYTPSANSMVDFRWNLSPDDPYLNPEENSGDNDVRAYRIFALDGVVPILLNTSVIPAGQNTASLYSLGYHSFGIKAVDICGNTSDLVALADACQDPPQVVFIIPSSGDTLSGSSIINGTASSSHPLDWVKLKIGDGPWIQLNDTSNWSYEWDTSSIADANYAITVQAHDSEDCLGSAFITVIVQNSTGQGENEAPDLDVTPPSISNVVVTSSGRGWVDIVITATITDDSGVSSVTYTCKNNGNMVRVDEMTHIGGDSYRCTYVRHQNDTYSVTISATDGVSNTGTYTTTD